MHLPSSIAVAFVLISTALHCQQADIGSEMPQIVAGVQLQIVVGVEIAKRIKEIDEKTGKYSKIIEEIDEQTGKYSKIMEEIEERIEKQRKELKNEIHELKSKAESMINEFSKIDSITLAKIPYPQSKSPAAENNTAHATIYACTLTIALFISFCTMHLVAAWMIQ